MLTKRIAHSLRCRRYTPAPDDDDGGLDGQIGAVDGHLSILIRHPAVLHANRHGRIDDHGVSSIFSLDDRESAYRG